MTERARYDGSAVSVKPNERPRYIPGGAALLSGAEWRREPGSMGSG
jgi:hypothetical protein